MCVLHICVYMLYILCICVYRYIPIFKHMSNFPWELKALLFVFLISSLKLPECKLGHIHLASAHGWFWDRLFSVFQNNKAFPQPCTVLNIIWNHSFAILVFSLFCSFLEHSVFRLWITCVDILIFCPSLTNAGLTRICKTHTFWFLRKRNRYTALAGLIFIFQPMPASYLQQSSCLELPIAVNMDVCLHV